jgi:hypothetical protein
MSEIIPMTNQSGNIRISAYQDKPVLTLKADTKWPFSFGLGKAKTILECIDAIEAFVASEGESFLPEPKVTKKAVAK